MTRAYEGATVATDQEPKKRAETSKGENVASNENVLLAFWGTLVLTVLAILGVAIANGSTSRTLFVGVLVAAAAGMAGAFLGFLFGLPRTGDDSGPALSARNEPAPGATTTKAKGPSKTRARANNNLLEISDWLTKIIVGAGLVGLQDLLDWSGGVSQMVGEGAGLPSVAQARVFGGATIAFFFGWGFLFVYIQTRTIISRVFAETERSLTEFVQETVDDKIQDAIEKKVAPELARVTTGSIMNLLYNSPRDAAQQARSYLESPENSSDARVRVYLACACGQLYRDSQNADERTHLRQEALDALTRALGLDPSLKGWVRGLLYVEDSEHLEGDDDLASFSDDPGFQALVGPRPSNERVETSDL